MLADDPVAVLDSLLEVGDDDLIQWWESASFELGSEEWVAAREQCRRKYEVTLRQVAQKWGNPDSAGALTIEDGELIVPELFPYSICEFASEVSIWDCEGHVACVWWGAMEHETQFEVCVGVAARGE